MARATACVVALLVMGACALATAQDQIHAHAGVGAGRQADAQGLRKLEDTTGKSQQPRADGAPMNLRQEDGLPLSLAHEHLRTSRHIHSHTPVGMIR